MCECFTGTAFSLLRRGVPLILFRWHVVGFSVPPVNASCLGLIIVDLIMGALQQQQLQASQVVWFYRLTLTDRYVLVHVSNQHISIAAFAGGCIA